MTFTASVRLCIYRPNQAGSSEAQCSPSRPIHRQTEGRELGLRSHLIVKKGIDVQGQAYPDTR